MIHLYLVYTKPLKSPVVGRDDWHGPMKERRMVNKMLVNGVDVDAVIGGSGIKDQPTMTVSRR